MIISGFFVAIYKIPEVQKINTEHYVLYIKDHELGGDYLFCNSFPSYDTALEYAKKWVATVENIVKTEIEERRFL